MQVPPFFLIPNDRPHERNDILTPAINKVWRKYEQTMINIAESIAISFAANIEHSFRPWMPPSEFHASQEVHKYLRSANKVSLQCTNCIGQFVLVQSWYHINAIETTTRSTRIHSSSFIRLSLFFFEFVKSCALASDLNEIVQRSVVEKKKLVTQTR